MAGKTAVKPKVKKEPEIDMTYIDDMLFRLDRAEANIEGIIESVDDKLGMHELTIRVEKVEARLGIG